MCDLKKKHGDQFKIFLDESWRAETGRDANDKLWYYEARGKFGTIYLHSADNNLLAVFITSVVISNRVERRHKDILKLYIKTSEGSVFLLNSNEFLFAADLIKARRRRQVSENERKRLRELSAEFGFKSGKRIYNNQTIAPKYA